MKPRYRVIPALILWASIAMAQMTVYPSNVPPITPENIIQNVFLGDGVDIVSTQYDGFAACVGVFDNAESVIGIKKGIVMSTGFVENTTRTNEALGSISGSTTDRLFQDEQLEQLANVEVRDISRFEITFVPSSDKLSFRYVFASEEYPDFVCADKNDAFGFFISGPKPGGGSYDFENIAKVPDPNDPSLETLLDLPVTINSVNPGEAGLFSNGNCDNSNESLDYSVYYNETPIGGIPAFNGFLSVFIAQADVIPCETYTIKIAIGDGKDREEDSAVFLEERSFSTESIKIEVDNPGIDGSLAEGCNDGRIIISLDQPTQDDRVIEYELLNSTDLFSAATPGIDYQTITGPLTIKAGESSVEIPIEPLLDNELEPTEFIYLSIRKSICTVDTLVLPLFDDQLETISIPDTVNICEAEEIEISVDLGAYLNPSDLVTFESNEVVFLDKNKDFSSSQVEVQLKDIELNPDIIAEICIDSLVHPRLNDLDIYIEAPSGQVLELSTDNGWRFNNSGEDNAFIQTCFTFTATENINLGDPVQGNMDLSNPTYTGNYLPEGSIDAWFSPLPTTLNGTYTLFIIDDSKFQDGYLYSWHISFNPKYDLSYEWSPSNGIDCVTCETISVLSDESKYYTLSVQDSYGCTYQDSVWIAVSDLPTRPELNCGPVNGNTLEIEWDDNNPFQLEVSLSPNGPWIPVDEISSNDSLFVDIEILSSNRLQVSGLSDNEEITLYSRNLNDNSCAGEISEISCEAETCPNNDILITDKSHKFSSCLAPLASEVIIEANSSNADLEYRLLTDISSEINTTGVFFNVIPGTWPIRVSNGLGCSVLDSIVIPENSVPELKIEVVDIDCFGAANGSITLSPTGFSMPLDVQWSNSETDLELTNLEKGRYTVIITDNDGCAVADTFDISEPEVVTYRYEQSELLECDGSNDPFGYLVVAGGTEPYSVIWDNNNFVSDTLLTLGNGEESFKIIDANNCEILGSVIVEQKTEIDIEVNLLKELVCFNRADAEAEAVPSSGVSPFIYEWDNGDETSLSRNLKGGMNYVTVTDAKKCQSIGEIEVAMPPAINSVPAVSPVSCNGSDDGSIELSLSGGVGNLGLSWNDGSNALIRNGLTPGEYCYTVTDTETCQITNCITIEEPQELDFERDIINVGCDEGNNGGINITPLGGSGEYLFQWSGPNNFSSTEQNISGLGVGSYSLIITDKNNSDCKTRAFDINVPVASEIGALIQTINSIECYGDETAIVRAIPSGGVPPFKYEWSDQNSTVETLGNVPAGNYTLTITDSENCSATSEVLIEQPTELKTELNVTDVTCHGENTGEIKGTVEGGTGNYEFQWNNGASDINISELTAGEYSLVVKDENGCTSFLTKEITQPEFPIEISFTKDDLECFGASNGSIELEVDNAVFPLSYIQEGKAAQTSPTFSELTAGSYLFTIVDRNNCRATKEVELTQYEEIQIEFNNSTEVPYNQDLQMDLDVSNNQGMMSYNWSVPESISIDCYDCPDPTLTVIQKSFSGMLSVVDELNCKKTKTFDINVLDRDIIDVPTGFSPNNDGNNDLLQVFGNPDINILEFNVYSRTGELIYSEQGFAPNENKGWDGNYDGDAMPTATYAWTIRYELENGDQESKHGTTTLIR